MKKNNDMVEIQKSLDTEELYLKYATSTENKWAKEVKRYMWQKILFIILMVLFAGYIAALGAEILLGEIPLLIARILLIFIIAVIFMETIIELFGNRDKYLLFMYLLIIIALIINVFMLFEM